MGVAAPNGHGLMVESAGGELDRLVTMNMVSKNVARLNHDNVNEIMLYKSWTWKSANRRML